MDDVRLGLERRRKFRPFSVFFVQRGEPFQLFPPPFGRFGQVFIDKKADVGSRYRFAHIGILTPAERAVNRVFP